MANPEQQFKQYQPDYSGMILVEYEFAKMKNLSGHSDSYWLDVIKPENSNEKKLPAVFFVHGGGFLPPCDRKQAYISWFARKLTAEGFAVISPDYPLFSDEQQMKDLGGEKADYSLAGEAVHLAYRYVIDHSDEIGIDERFISMMGGSAGSMTAFYAISEHEDSYRAFINLWGVPEELPDLRKFPPVLSVHGTADQLVPYEREAKVQELLERYGIEHRLISLPEKGHTPLDKMALYIPDIIALLRRTAGK